jgi:hypothetical protein
MAGSSPRRLCLGSASSLSFEEEEADWEEDMGRGGGHGSVDKCFRLDDLHHEDEDAFENKHFLNNDGEDGPYHETGALHALLTDSLLEQVPMLRMSYLTSFSKIYMHAYMSFAFLS